MASTNIDIWPKDIAVDVKDRPSERGNEGVLYAYSGNQSARIQSTLVLMKVLPFMEFIPACSNHSTQMKTLFQKRKGIEFRRAGLVESILGE